jgi:hypothetical protein
LFELITLCYRHLLSAFNIQPCCARLGVPRWPAVRAYGDEAVARITEKLRVMILEAKDQPADSKAYGSLENTTQFGVAAQVGWAARPGCCAAACCGALCCAVLIDAVLFLRAFHWLGQGTF